MANTPPIEPHHRITDPQTIKVFILSLMEHVGYALTYTGVADIVMQDRVVDFVDFGENFQKLIEKGHVTEHSEDVEKDELNPYGHPVYTVSETGHRVVEALEDTIPPFTREKSCRNALRYLDFVRSGTSTAQNLTTIGNNEMLHLEIRDRRGLSFDLTIRPDNPYQLDLMRSKFAERPENIYKGFLALLTGEKDYLFADKKS